MPVIKDNFQDEVGIGLPLHTPDIDKVGGGWLIHNGLTANIDNDPDSVGTYLKSIGTTYTDVGYIDSGLEDLDIKVTVRGNNSSAFFSVVGRFSPSGSQVIYYALAFESSNVISLEKNINNSRTVLATKPYPGDSNVYNVGNLIIEGNSISGSVDIGGISLGPLTDTSIPNGTNTGITVSVSFPGITHTNITVSALEVINKVTDSVVSVDSITVTQLIIEEGDQVISNDVVYGQSALSIAELYSGNDINSILTELNIQEGLTELSNIDITVQLAGLDNSVAQEDTFIEINNIIITDNIIGVENNTINVDFETGDIAISDDKQPDSIASAFEIDLITANDITFQQVLTTLLDSFSSQDASNIPVMIFNPKDVGFGFDSVEYEKSLFLSDIAIFIESLFVINKLITLQENVVSFEVTDIPIVGKSIIDNTIAVDQIESNINIQLFDVIQSSFSTSTNGNAVVSTYDSAKHTDAILAQGQIVLESEYVQDNEFINITLLQLIVDSAFMTDSTNNDNKVITVGDQGIILDEKVSDSLIVSKVVDTGVTNISQLVDVFFPNLSETLNAIDIGIFRTNSFVLEDMLATDTNNIQAVNVVEESGIIQDIPSISTEISLIELVGGNDYLVIQDNLTVNDNSLIQEITKLTAHIGVTEIMNNMDVENVSAEIFTTELSVSESSIIVFHFQIHLITDEGLTTEQPQITSNIMLNDYGLVDESFNLSQPVIVTENISMLEDINTVGNLVKKVSDSFSALDEDDINLISVKIQETGDIIESHKQDSLLLLTENTQGYDDYFVYDNEQKLVNILFELNMRRILFTLNTLPEEH